ncbi:MAG TPA: 4Fe-4S binding protein, partial [Methanomassiliicoccales archaeon]|nr:4Fe-4S binding protein [Methanomassiliicoccales archaeon]
FGRKVTEKAKSSPGEISLSSKLSARGFGFANPLPGDQIVNDLPDGYHKRVVDRVKWLWMIDSSNEDVCTDCGICADSCPTGAIDPETFERNEDVCIRCMACVEDCPSGALRLAYSDKPQALELFAGLDKAMASRKEPETTL